FRPEKVKHQAGTEKNQVKRQPSDAGNSLIMLLSVKVRLVQDPACPGPPDHPRGHQRHQKQTQRKKYGRNNHGSLPDGQGHFNGLQPKAKLSAQLLSFKSFIHFPSPSPRSAPVFKPQSTGRTFSPDTARNQL